MIAKYLLCGVAALALAVTAAAAETVKFQTPLTKDAEVPPTNSTGSGNATASLDTVTHELTYDVTFQGFSSPVTMAHFHGPAQAGQNAGIVVPLGNNPTSPIHGTVKLTDEQQRQLMSGLWYVNVHTQNHPAGAIRGQMTPPK